MRWRLIEYKPKLQAKRPRRLDPRDNVPGATIGRDAKLRVNVLFRHCERSSIAKARAPIVSKRHCGSKRNVPSQGGIGCTRHVRCLARWRELDAMASDTSQNERSPS